MNVSTERGPLKVKAIYAESSCVSSCSGRVELGHVHGEQTAACTPHVYQKGHSVLIYTVCVAVSAAAKLKCRAEKKGRRSQKLEKVRFQFVF